MWEAFNLPPLPAYLAIILPSSLCVCPRRRRQHLPSCGLHVWCVCVCLWRLAGRRTGLACGGAILMWKAFPAVFVFLDPPGCGSGACPLAQEPSLCACLPQLTCLPGRGLAPLPNLPLTLALCGPLPLSCVNSFGQMAGRKISLALPCLPCIEFPLCLLTPTFLPCLSHWAPSPLCVFICLILLVEQTCDCPALPLGMWPRVLELGLEAISNL